MNYEVLNIKEVSYEELGVYFGNRLSEYFERWYSKNIYDYGYFDINLDNPIDGYENIYSCSYEGVETGSGKPPILIDYYVEVLTDEDDNIDFRYYIDKYYIDKGYIYEKEDSTL